MYAQNVQRLETNPSFKGISIGMPISSIADELTYENSVNGFILYKTTAANYCSVFNVRMDFVRVVAKDGNDLGQALVVGVVGWNLPFRIRS